MGGLVSSSSRSSACCSSIESTSAIVDATCCASTARHNAWRKAAALEATSRVVQVVDDTDQAFDRGKKIYGTRREREVLAREPRVRGRFVPPEGVERAEQAHEQNGELPLLRPVTGKLIVTGGKTRDGGVGNTEDAG